MELTFMSTPVSDLTDAVTFYRDTRVPRHEIPGGVVVGLADPSGNVFSVVDQDGTADDPQA